MVASPSKEARLHGSEDVGVVVGLAVPAGVGDRRRDAGRDGSTARRGRVTRRSHRVQRCYCLRSGSNNSIFLTEFPAALPGQVACAQAGSSQDKDETDFPHCFHLESLVFIPSRRVYLPKQAPGLCQ